MERLESLQNKAVKVIAGRQHFDDSTAYYKQLNILKIEDLYTLEVAKLVHKVFRNKLPNRFSSFITPINAIHTRITRLASSNPNLYFPLFQIKSNQIKNCKMQKFFKFLEVIIWNSVPQDMKILLFDSYKIQFKQRLMYNYQ